MDPDGWRHYEQWAYDETRRYGPRGIVAREDIEQAARIALWRAWEAFDPGRGVRFTTFARHYVHGEVKRAFRDTSEVPRHVWERGERFDALQILDDTEAFLEPFLSCEERGYEEVEAAALLERLSARDRGIAGDLLAGWSVQDAVERAGYPRNAATRIRRRLQMVVRAVVGQ